MPKSERLDVLTDLVRILGLYDFSHEDIGHGDVHHATFVTGITCHGQFWRRSSRGRSSRNDLLFAALLATFVTVDRLRGGGRH